MLSSDKIQRRDMLVFYFNSNEFFRQMTKNQLEKSKLYIICFKNKSFKMIKRNLSEWWKTYQMFLQYLQKHIQFPSEENERCCALIHGFQSPLGYKSAVNGRNYCTRIIG